MSPGHELLPHHADLLARSGITEAVAAARGYRSVTTKAELKRLGFTDSQAQVPALLISIWGVSGQIVLYQARPDQPRVVDGKVVKYETPRGAHMALDVHPHVRERLNDPRIPLFVTEGARKVDSAVSMDLCCIGVLGVWNWRGKNEHGGLAALPDWDSVPLKGDGGARRVYLAFDSDAMTKAEVHAALRRLKGFLEARGAEVWIVYLPAGTAGTKTGLDDYFAGGGTVDALLALAGADLRPLGGAAARREGQLPVIEVTPDMVAVIDAGEHALLEAKGVEVYQRTGTLVRVTRESPRLMASFKRPARAPLIAPIPDPNLRELLARAALFMREDQSGGLIRVLPPMWVVKGLSARASWDFPFLEAVTESPALRPDGSILDTAGYDAATGLLFEPNAVFPPVHERPTDEDARRAVGVLLEPFREFPFVAPSDRAATLAAILTQVGRHLIYGPCPMFGVGAPVPGSGKGLLVQATTLIATGRLPSTMAPAHDPDELRKVITTIAIEGHPAVLFDNAEGRFGSAVLAAALTATEWSGRILGYSRTITAPLHTVFFCTGNNLVFVGDTFRRVIPVYLDPEVEKPEDRVFEHPDLLQYVRDRRPELFAAALTILRNQVLAGQPDHGKPRLGSYEAWDRLVRSTVLRLLDVDPTAGRARLREEEDEDIAVIRTLLQVWRDHWPNGAGATIQDALREAQQDSRLFAALAALDLRSDGSRLNPKALGYGFRKFHRRIVGGLRLEKAGEARNGTLWCVRPVSGPPTARGDAAHGGDGFGPRRTETFDADSCGDGGDPTATGRSPHDRSGEARAATGFSDGPTDHRDDLHRRRGDDPYTERLA